MNNSVNVQSPTFGMTYRVGDIKKFSRYLNEQEPEAIKTITEEVKRAAEQLKNTKHANATLCVEDDCSALYHRIDWREPVFNDKGEVTMAANSCNTDGNITDAVKRTIEKEQSMIAAHEYANQMAEVLKEVAF